MDWTAAGLEPDPRPDGHLLCRAYARVTPPWPDVKGKINCSSSHLTSDPSRVMLLTWQQPWNPAAAMNKFCSICTPNGVYTELGIDPKMTKKIAEPLNFLLLLGLFLNPRQPSPPMLAARHRSMATIFPRQNQIYATKIHIPVGTFNNSNYYQILCKLAKILNWDSFFNRN